jgi:adenylate cyclase
MSADAERQPSEPDRQSTPPAASFRPSTPPRAPSISDADTTPGGPLSLVPPRPTAASIKQAAKRIGLAHVDTREAFERRLVREILVAERFRALFLFAIPTVALFALVVIGGAYPDTVAQILHGRFDRAPIGFFLMATAGFELYVLVWIRRLLERHERPKWWRRYVHAFVETSLPSAVILYYTSSDGATEAMLMPSAFVYSIFILLSTLGLDSLLCTFVGLVAAAEYAAIAVAWGTLDARVIGKAVVLFVSGVAAGFVARRLRNSFSRAIESVGERARILGVFGQHVSPEIVERLVAGKADVKSEQRLVCVMFLDIRNFTSYAETNSATAVVDYLNTVFEPTVDAVVKRHGIVNKFLGDGLMAVFGAPTVEDDPSGAAIGAAIDIVKRIDELVSEGKIPPTRVGIGLHTGQAVVGNIGSAQRKEYTVIGDVVNVASRIEALNKELGTTILCSDETWLHAKANTEHVQGVQAQPHDDVKIRGRKQAMRVWQLT